MKELEKHPLADMMPITDDEDYRHIREDIRTHGQRVKIILFQGKILDGNTRYKALVQLKRPIQTEEFVGSQLDAIQAVWSHNFCRRHLTQSQKAIAAVNLSKHMQDVDGVPEAEADKIARTVTKASVTSMNSAKKIAREDKGLAQGIMNGTVTISEANRVSAAKSNPRSRCRVEALDYVATGDRVIKCLSCHPASPELTALIQEAEKAHRRVTRLANQIEDWFDNWDEE